MKNLVCMALLVSAPGLAATFSGLYRFQRSLDSDSATLCQDFEITLKGSQFFFHSPSMTFQKNLTQAAGWRPIGNGRWDATPRVWENVTLGPSILQLEVVERSGLTPPFGEFQNDWSLVLRPRSSTLWEVEIQKSEAVRPAVVLTHLQAACLYTKIQR